MASVSKTEREVDIEINQRERANYFSLRPITGLLIVSACYNIHSSKKKGRTFLLWIYQGAFICMFLAYLARSLYYMTTNVFNYITPLLLTCQCVGSCVICWKLFCRKHGHFYESMKMWHCTISKMEQNEMSIDFDYFRKRQRAVVGCCVFLQLMSNTAQFVITFVMYSAEELRKLGYNDTYTAPFEDTVTSRIVVTIPLCAQMMTLITRGFFLINISIMLCCGIRAFNKYLEHVYLDRKNDSDASLESVRRIHFDLCQIVSNLDKDLQFLYGNIYIWTLGVSIIVLYGLLKFPLTIFIIVIYIFYLGLTLGMMFAVSIYAAYVHEEVSMS